MLIKHQGTIINLENVIAVHIEDAALRFEMPNRDAFYFSYQDEDEAEKMFDRLFQDWQWQRQTCTLD